MPRIRALAFLFVVQTALMVLLGIFLIRALDQIARDKSRLISSGPLATACLLEVFRQVRPLLEHSPSVKQPLEEFLLLEGRLVSNRRCPKEVRLRKGEIPPPLGLARAGVPERLPS